MRVLKREENENHWNIVSDDGLEYIAKIGMSYSYTGGSTRKYLYYNDYNLGTVKNQEHAIEKLEEYLKEKESRLRMLQVYIDQLTKDIHYVTNEISIETLKAEKKKKQEEYHKLKDGTLK